jgi:ribosome biogenesis GTPase A
MEQERMQIQWYPGHMTKTRRQIEADLKLVDAVCEIVDARIPISSRNPDIDAICGNKPRIVVLNRMDLADNEVTKRWLQFFREKGMAAVATDCKSKKGISLFEPAVHSVLQEKIARNAAKGMNKALKVMIVGIPNVGKSTLINQISGRKGAKAENRPGVTRGKQWVTVNNNLLLLDTPGILWPKFEERRVGENLALTGAIRDGILDVESLAVVLCKRLRMLYPTELAARYKLGDMSAYDEYSDYDLFEAIGRKRGFLISGGEVNTERTALTLLDEFRGCKIGRVTLDRYSKEELHRA